MSEVSGTPLRQALALAIGATGGALAWEANLPLAWMLGAMTFTTIAAMTGVPVGAPLRLRPLVIPVIGVMLGSSLRSDILIAALGWLPTLAILPVFLSVAAGLSYLLYRRIGGYDGKTAYFCAMPGGLNEMILMGTAYGASAHKIAMAHAIRILATILCIALVFGLVFGVTSRGAGGRTWIALDAFGLADVAWLTAAAVIGVPLGRVLRLPAGNLIGPMLLSGAAHIAGLVTLPPPTLLVNGAQLVLGTVIGCRFAGIRFSDIHRDLWLAVASTLLMLAAATGFSLLIAGATDTPVSQAFLAYSPGGLTEMSLLALAMHQEVAYVSVMHIARIMLVIFSAPLLFRALRNRQ